MTSTKWIRFGDHLRLAVTIQGNWMAEPSERIKALFDFIDEFLKLDVPEPVAPCEPDEKAKEQP